MARLGLEDWVAGLPDGLATRLDGGEGRLSAGEVQLVGLVRAALVDPAVLVLDEATADIDPRMAHKLETAIDVLRTDRTLIVIAHRESTIERLPPGHLPRTRRSRPAAGAPGRASVGVTEERRRRSLTGIPIGDRPGPALVTRG